VYEAALEMYELLLPLVQQHVDAHPGGRVAFTGHSLGGSLATLLMLLYVHRCSAWAGVWPGGRAAGSLLTHMRQLHSTPCGRP
jgi:putative lipase involved disintegration of autophagic bodies